MTGLFSHESQIRVAAVLRHGSRGILRDKQTLQIVGELARLTGIVNVVHKGFALLDMLVQRLPRELGFKMRSQNRILLIKNPLALVQFQQTHGRCVDEDITEPLPVGRLDLGRMVEKDAEHAKEFVIRGFYAEFTATIT